MGAARACDTMSQPDAPTTARVYRGPSAGHDTARKEMAMPRKVGERYVCEKCGAQLVYEKACPCPEGMKHSEICCGEQMKQVKQ